jgi:hypothetical protein
MSVTPTRTTTKQNLDPRCTYVRTNAGKNMLSNYQNFQVTFELLPLSKIIENYRKLSKIIENYRKLRQKLSKITPEIIVID